MKCALVLLTVVLCGSQSCVVGQDSVMFNTGVASVDVTPSFPVRLNGFGGRRQESEGVRQPLWAKAIAVGTTDEDTVVIITVDTLGIPDDMTERLAAKLKSKGIDRSRLAICASHTHSGPMIRNCANTLFGEPISDEHWQHILQYTEELESKLETVANDAIANRKPAKLSWGIGKVGFAFNRRTKGGPVDHDLPLLAVHDPDGKLRAIFTNYACHCVTLSDDMISGDWAGYAMDHIQRRNPGCVALISIGCGADSNPRGGVLGSKFDVADSLGNELADEVQRLLATPLQALTKAPASMLERVTLKLAPLPTREQWEEKAKNQNAIGHHARTQLARLDRGEALMTEISYPIQTVAFGDELAWAFLPGEVVVDYALRLKKELNGSRIWMNAYTSACPGYVPSERILREGGYEGGGAMVYYDIPGAYASGLEQTIVDTVERQLKEKFLPVANAKKTDAKADKTNGIRPLSPSEAVSSLRTKPGFHAELVASEPMIESPVAISFGPDGRLWVAEMSDYPQGGAESGGRIRCLHDDNNDGRYDRSEVFLTGLAYPTGVTVWRNGILVCAAPDILYAEDTNNDGKADKIEKLFTGFATHNYQARVNSLEYGLDGWVYGSCGLFGGQITSVKAGEVIALGQRDFRINPDSGVLEPATGATQQGRVRNDWGDWFGCNNGTMLMHYPLANEYLRRNPYLTPPLTVVGIAAEPNPDRLYSISNQVLFMLSGPPNRPTAACGLGIYRDDAFGPDFHGDAFTCEPVNNLVHRQHLSTNGVSFTSRRPEDELDREFLASTDPWFRPVQAHTGLDGALWVVDMYRYVIEHPIWIPPDTLATLDTRAGASMGRIYRIVSDTASAQRTPRLSSLHGEQLATAMDVANGIQRDLVQQLIQWNHDTGAAARLKFLAIESSRPEVRIQALSTLANLEAPSAEMLLKLLADPDPHVRRHAVRISESQLSSSPELASVMLTLASDDDAFVRLQVAYSAAFLEPSSSARVLASLISRDGENVHMMSAIESSLSSQNIVEIIRRKEEQISRDALDQILTNAATLADESAFRSLLKEMADTSVNAKLDATALQHLIRLAQFVDAWSRRSKNSLSPTDETVRALWKPALDNAVNILSTDAAPVRLRAAAAQLISLGPYLGEPHLVSLAALLTSRTPPELQSAAITAMRKDGRVEVANVVLADWATREPRLRKEIIALLLSRSQWAERLLAAIADGTMSSGELELPQQQQLLDHAQESIRSAAATTFKRRTSADRQQIINRYTTAVTNNGDAGKGRVAFQKHCSSCHRLQDIGHIIGPDIAGYSGKPLQSLLIAMFDPNHAVDPRYQAYAVALRDGRSVSGLITEENASSLTLLGPEGKRESVLRSEIDEIRSTGKSLMPEGFEQKATTDDVNDLWAYFRTMHLPPKTLPGNTPTIVEIPAAGNVALQATQAEIYGGDITFETPFQNIGYWHNVDDHVRWRIHSVAARNVQIWAEWSCDENAAGNSFSLEGTEPALKGTVGTTGGWDRYQLVRLGNVLIREGESDVIVRPGQNLNAALADLRAIHIVAIGGVPLATGMVQSTKQVAKSRETPAAIAAFLIDDANLSVDREKLIAAHLDKAAEIIPLMTIGLPEESGSKEEYRRIPWIWRVAIAVGKTTNIDQHRSVLKASLPETGERLEHWQAVVIGGGLINGIGMSGKWPLDEFVRIIGDDTTLKATWQNALNLSSVMADDETVSTGTRYDALRMVAMRDVKISLPHLVRYLQKDIHEELQMGAISGISDVQDDAVAALLISGYVHFSEANRKLTIGALLRNEARCLETLNAIASKKLPPKLRKDELIEELRKHNSAAVRQRTAEVLGQ